MRSTSYLELVIELSNISIFDNAKPEYELRKKTLAYTISSVAFAALALIPVVALASLQPIAVTTSFALFLPAAIGCGFFAQKSVESYKAGKGKTEYEHAQTFDDSVTKKYWLAKAGLNKHPLALLELANSTKAEVEKYFLLSDAARFGNQQTKEEQQRLKKILEDYINLTPGTGSSTCTIVNFSRKEILRAAGS